MINKWKILTIVTTILLVNTAQAEDSTYIDSLKRATFLKIDSTGFFYAIPGTVQEGQAFNEYKMLFYDDYFDRGVLVNSWTDPVTGITHNKYQQYFDVIPVQGAYIIEHVNPSGYVKFFNGKVANLRENQTVPTIIGEEDAFSALIDEQSMHDYQFAWDDPDHEQQKRSDMADSSASYHPLQDAELIMALVDKQDLGYMIDGTKYTICWKFTIKSLNPYFLRDYFVDAETGEFVMYEELTRDQGTAEIWYNGTRTIDIHQRGWPHNDYILRAEDGGRNFETRHSESPESTWWLLDKTDHGSSSWGTTEHGATAIHYFTMQSWRYFDQIHDRVGMDDNSMEIRIMADIDIFNNAAYELDGGISYLRFGVTPEGGYYGRAIDIVAHEFTHGVTMQTANLSFSHEQGALDESFSDIFGQLVEFFSEGTNASWALGDDEPNLFTRSMLDPKSDGNHYVGQCVEEVGQPDTYEGEFWCDCDISCDRGGVHVNSGVQNRWFTLLVLGGTGTNDNEDDYSVTGIGIDDAASITYWSLTNLLISSSEYVDARASSIAAAIELFGECSMQHAQVENAWYAVGVGEESECNFLGESTPVSESLVRPIVYPNPTNDVLNIRLRGNATAIIRMSDISGKRVFETMTTESINSINLNALSKGIYMLSIESNGKMYNERIILTD